MNESTLIERIIFILITGISLGVAFWVYRQKKDSNINKTFFLYTIFYTLWIIFGFLANSIQNHDLALIFIKLRFVAVSFCAISVYFFALAFPKEEKIHSILNKTVLTGGLLLALISVFTNSIINNIELKNWGTNIVFGDNSIIFFLWIIFLAFIIPLILYQKYFSLLKSEKLQIQYFLIGITIFIISNLIFNIYFPAFQKTYQYYQFGDYSAIALLFFTAYAIVRQNLFGIRVILTQILVGVIAILLFIQILDAETTVQYIWKSALFLTFIVFGYSLIRSVLREIKLRQELENAYVELKKLDTAKSEFISIASHQLRTPLAAMKGYISMILDGSYGDISSQQKSKLENVFQSNERLIRMVNDLLNVSRIESGRVELNLQATEIEDIISGVVEILKLHAKDKKLKLVWEKSKKDLPKAYIDPDKTREIILNIVDNAIKYTQEGKIEISVKAKISSPLVSIADTGAGMSQEEIAKMFKSFSRGSAGNQFFTEGMGLGLYIARQFTEMQKGRIWAESDGKGKGSTFFIELPIK